MDPLNLRAYYQQAYGGYELKRYDDAIQSCLRMEWLAPDPENAEATACLRELGPRDD